MNWNLLRHLKGVALSDTPNRLPGSPESIAAQIAEVERDIAEWKQGIATSNDPYYVRLIQSEVALSEGRLHILRLQLAEVNRRKQTVPVPFPERRGIDSIITFKEGE